MPLASPVMALLLAAEGIPAATLPEAGMVEVLKTQADADDRMTVPVRIGHHGSFRFVIDTGSQSTVVSTRLAEQLALPPARKARIVGVGGTEIVDTAMVAELGLGRRSYSDLEVALLEARHIGAEGIVGIDSLQRQRVLLDFERNTMAVGDARTLGGNSGFEIVVTARRRLGQLIMTNAVVDGVRTQVIIDTGANTSVGNLALQQALRHRNSNSQVKLLSATGQEISAELGFPRKLTISDIDITNLLVAYADAPVFAVLDLDKRPALMLGMRELRLFKRIAIDFNSRKVYFDLPEMDRREFN
ncbi:MAG: aspartyl protease family protein [Novosphingobium sp.]